MTIDQMKNTTFPKSSFDEWKDVAVRTLKDKKFEQLITPTFEGIDLQPLYTSEHLHNTLNYSDIVSNAKQNANWLIAQATASNSATEFLHKTKVQLERGNEMIVYAATASSWTWSSKELKELASLLKTHPFYLSVSTKDDEIIGVFELFSKQGLSELNGYVAGVSSSSLTTMITTNEIHHAGGTAVHELTNALVKLSKLADKHSGFTSKVAVQFAVDTNFFMEISKLRAFRVLWKAFTTAYEMESIAIPVLAESSLRSYSKLDSTVNLLRAGNAAFSAVLGGADMIMVHPHDVLTGSSPSSERIARNIQLVIREETMVNKMIDVAAGSYYVESLTADLVRQAWALFLQVVEMSPELQENYLMELAKDVQSSRIEVLAMRKASLIGTNMYANPDDTVSASVSNESTERLAIPFELLRKHFEDNLLKAAVVSFGVLKEVKPRADFVQGFLQAGGLNPIMSPVFTEVNDAYHWLKTNKVDYAVVAAKDEITKEILPLFLQQKHNQTVIDVAGKFAEEKQWQELGLHGAIFAGQDLIGKMQRLIQIQKEGGGRYEA